MTLQLLMQLLLFLLHVSAPRSVSASALVSLPSSVSVCVSASVSALALAPGLVGQHKSV